MKLFSVYFLLGSTRGESFFIIVIIGLKIKTPTAISHVKKKRKKVKMEREEEINIILKKKQLCALLEVLLVWVFSFVKDLQLLRNF